MNNKERIEILMCGKMILKSLIQQMNENDIVDVGRLTFKDQKK